MNRVKAGSIYIFEPSAIDVLDPCADVDVGDRVRVVNLPGAPPANTMGHAHIESLDGQFLGLVSIHSLRSPNAVPSDRPVTAVTDNGE